MNAKSPLDNNRPPEHEILHRLSDDDMEQVVEMIETRRMIDAIHLVFDRTKSSLGDSKAVVEYLAKAGEDWRSDRMEH